MGVEVGEDSAVGARWLEGLPWHLGHVRVSNHGPGEDGGAWAPERGESPEGWARYVNGIHAARVRALEASPQQTASSRAYRRYTLSAVDAAQCTIDEMVCGGMPWLVVWMIAPI